MRKWVLIVAILGLLAVPVATAAAAPAGLRDPFDPLLSTNTGDGTTTDGTPTTDTNVDDPTTTDPAPAPSDDGLPTTGRDATDWLAMAYVLVAVGGGLLALSRIIRPTRRRLFV